MTEFNEYLQYDPNTGIIIWIKQRKNIQVGNIAGYTRPEGYLQICLNGKRYYNHRLAWYLHYGVWPINDIDHINGIKNDNRINNLRDVTHTQNLLNQKKHREKTVKYYSYNKDSKLWVIKKRINNKQTYLGSFKTKELARQFIQNNLHLFPGAKP